MKKKAKPQPLSNLPRIVLAAAVIISLFIVQEFHIKDAAKKQKAQNEKLMVFLDALSMEIGCESHEKVVDERSGDNKPVVSDRNVNEGWYRGLCWNAKVLHDKYFEMKIDYIIKYGADDSDEADKVIRKLPSWEYPQPPKEK